MKQPQFPSVFRIEQIWLWREEELEPIACTLAAPLGLADVSRDYEDTWEWIDIRRGDGTTINLSRMHDWKTGVYSDPVIISLHGPVLDRERVLRAVAETAKQAFGCRVFAGEIDHNRDGKVRVHDSIEL